LRWSIMRTPDALRSTVVNIAGIIDATRRGPSRLTGERRLC
jgi:hypothetical protein